MNIRSILALAPVIPVLTIEHIDHERWWVSAPWPAREISRRLDALARNLA
jgi:hypothetical protein